MKKSNENDAKAKPRRDYNILTDTIARTIAPGEPPMRDKAVKCLWLYPKSRKGRGYWYYIYTSPVTKKPVEHVFGHYPEVPIAEAREFAQEANKLKAKGIDPKIARDSEKAVTASNDAIPTFEEAARAC